MILGAIGFVVWGAVAYLTFVSVPRGARLFAEFHMAVPLFTELVVRFAIIAVPALFVVTGVLCTWVQRRWAWFWFALVLPMFLGTCIFVSLYLPTVRLLQGLTGTTSGWWNHLIGW
ncbi:MAG TPA: hypothetical protein VFE62_04405 [Gemmataceae bacterium]|nr:hypothetical protein [Gemmataceae bacterium]